MGKCLEAFCSNSFFFFFPFLGLVLIWDGNWERKNSRCDEEFSWECGFGRFEVVVTRFLGGGVGAGFGGR